jgi:putative GTP pyrophosphokinase
MGDVNATSGGATGDVLKYYSYWLPFCKHLRRVASDLLEEHLVREHIKVDSITGRTKSFESFLDKMQRTQKPCREIYDLVGIRVVCLFRSDIDTIAELIRREFASLPGMEESKFDTKSVETFGYFDRKLIVKLHPSFTGNWLQYLGIRDLPFEIQIKTVGMHAWAAVSHYLAYKTESEIPRELKRDFQALSALFHIADTQFELVVKATEELRKSQEPRRALSLESEIDIEGMLAYIVRRFPDRVNSPALGQVTRFLKEFAGVGIHRLRDVEAAVEHWLPAIERWEAEEGPKFTDIQNEKEVRLHALGVINVALAEEFPHYAIRVAVVRLPEAYRARRSTEL